MAKRKKTQEKKERGLLTQQSTRDNFKDASPSASYPTHLVISCDFMDSEEMLFSGKRTKATIEWPATRSQLSYQLAGIAFSLIEECVANARLEFPPDENESLDM